MTTSRSKLTISLMNEILAKQTGETMTTSIMKQQGTTKSKQKLVAKEVFSPQITKFRRERIIPIYRDKTWSADLNNKSSLRLNTIIFISLF